MASFPKPDDDYVDIGSMIAPEIAPGVGFCDEDEEELGILVVGYTLWCPQPRSQGQVSLN